MTNQKRGKRGPYKKTREALAAADERKKSQRYRPEAPMCANCRWVTFRASVRADGYYKRQNWRCVYGGFPTNAKGLCIEYERSD